MSNKNKTLPTDIRVFVSHKTLRSKENTERYGRDGRRGSVFPNCITPFIPHSFTDHPTEQRMTLILKKCKNCTAVVVQEDTDSQDNNVDAENSYGSVPSRQESMTVFKSSRVSKESCFVPTPPPTEKQTRIWRTRTDEIIWKQRVVNGFLKREN